VCIIQVTAGAAITKLTTSQWAIPISVKPGPNMGGSVPGDSGESHELALNIRPSFFVEPFSGF
jgi:hypothetical protein